MRAIERRNEAFKKHLAGCLQCRCAVEFDNPTYRCDEEKAKDQDEDKGKGTE